MKKSILLLSSLAIFSTAINAQTKSPEKAANMNTSITAPPQPSANSNQNADLSMKYKNEEHTFGTIPEGPSVSYDFEFKNIVKTQLFCRMYKHHAVVQHQLGQKNQSLLVKVQKLQPLMLHKADQGSLQKQLLLPRM